MAKIDTSSLDPYLRELVQRQATDLMISVGSPPRIRVDGELLVLDEPDVDAEAAERVIQSMLPDELWQICLRDKEVDFSFDWLGLARIRGNVFHQRGSLAMALRIIPFTVPGFEELGVPTIVASWSQLRQGLVLVTGPTGAGK